MDVLLRLVEHRIRYRIYSSTTTTHTLKMSLQDRLASQDASMLLGLGASLSLVYSSHPAGVTNFALFVRAQPERARDVADAQLFGIVAYEMRSSTVPFRQVSAAKPSRKVPFGALEERGRVSGT